MTLRPDHIAGLIDAYLDGRLNDEQRAELDALARTDAEVASTLAAAAMAEDRLKHLFAPPTALDLTPLQLQPPAPLAFPVAAAAAGREAAHEGHPPAARTRRWMPLAAAAAILLAAAGAWYTFLGPTAPPGTTPIVRKPLSPGELYATLQKRKFKPTFVCEDNAQFAKFLGDRFGSGMVLAQADHVDVLGWAYADGMIGEATAVIMTRVDGHDVIILVDQKAFDRPLPEVPPNLHMFRDVCNGLVLYEVTPLDVARLLPLARPAEPLVYKSD